MFGVMIELYILKGDTNMKRILFIMARILLLVLSGCTGNGPKDHVVHKDEIVIYQATDMHYLSPQLTDNCPEFIQMLKDSDGKMAHYIDPIMDAFVEDVIARAPDAVLLTGDITYNGEKLSFLDLARKLKKIEDRGIQVLVIPGNHDIDYPLCFGYKEGTYYRTERFSREEYEQAYADFGLNEAVSRAPDSFSYIYQISDNVYIIALDCDTTLVPIVTNRTFDWLSEAIKEIPEGATVISMTHENLLDHYSGIEFRNDLTILNNTRLIDLYEENGVRLNLCGHIHTQHIWEEGNIVDIATEAMSVIHCNYGVIRITPEEIHYTTQHTDVDGWAARNGVEDENLLNFYDYGMEFWIEGQSGRNYSGFDGAPLTEEDKKIMSNFFTEMNAYYFEGNLRDHVDELKATEGYRVWMEKGENIWRYTYIVDRMNNVRNEPVVNDYTLKLS